MSSVWDDPELNEGEEVTPLPEAPAGSASLNLAPERLEQMTAEVIERVVREIVPDLAERIIREEIARLSSEGPD